MFSMIDREILGKSFVEVFLYFSFFFFFNRFKDVTHRKRQQREMEPKEKEWKQQSGDVSN